MAQFIEFGQVLIRYFGEKKHECLDGTILI